jgi:hypothetical protein
MAGLALDTPVLEIFLGPLLSPRSSCDLVWRILQIATDQNVRKLMFESDSQNFPKFHGRETLLR